MATGMSTAGGNGMASRAAEAAHGIVDKAASAVSRLEEKGDELFNASDKLVSSAGKYVANNITNKPLAVLGAGLVIGFLISRLIR